MNMCGAAVERIEIVLQRVAVYCSVLQCTAVPYYICSTQAFMITSDPPFETSICGAAVERIKSLLQCVLQCVAVYYSVLQCFAISYDIYSPQAFMITSDPPF